MNTKTERRPSAGRFLPGGGAALLPALLLLFAPLGALDANHNNPPGDPTYTVTIDSPDDGETFEKDSGETATATGTETDDSGDSDVSDDITWSGDAGGSGATSDDFTTSAGERTLTADLEDESDSITTYIVEKDTIEAEDTSTSAGTRKSGSSLVMVYSDTDRDADITFTYSDSGSPGAGYPKWTGDSVTGSDGDLTATFSGDVGVYSVTAEYAKGATEIMFIDVVDDLDYSNVWDLDSEYLDAIQDKINSALDQISGGDGPDLDLTGSVSVSFSVVDHYDDGNASGLFADANGTISASFPDVEFESVAIPLGSSGMSMKIIASVTGTTVSVSLDTDYDQSQSSPGQISGSVAGATTVSAGATVGIANTDVLTVSLQGSVNLNAGGSLSYAAKEVTLAGSLSSSDLDVDWSVEARLGWAGDYTLYSDSHTFANSGTDFPYETTLYSF